MIVWYNAGAMYSPRTNSWRPVSGSGAPIQRAAYTVVWTGSAMIVWGGSGGAAGVLGDGARYIPPAPLTNLVFLPLVEAI